MTETGTTPGMIFRIDSGTDRAAAEHVLAQELAWRKGGDPDDYRDWASRNVELGFAAARKGHVVTSDVFALPERWTCERCGDSIAHLPSGLLGVKMLGTPCPATGEGARP